MFARLKRIADHRNASPAATCRHRRSAWFRALIADLPRPVRVLDVGGTEAFWERTDLVRDRELDVTLLNLRAPACRHPHIRSVAGDARDLGEYGDAAFDVVFSNSVIEHVGEDEDQGRMAREVRRVARRYFVQTPNYWFPVEPHFLVPGFQFMPVAVRVWLATHFSLGWYPRFADRAAAEAEVRSIRLISRRRFRRLFPDATIHTERVLGMPKSFVALRDDPA